LGGRNSGETKRRGRGGNLELDVEDAAEQLGGQIVEAHLVLGDLVHGRLHLTHTHAAVAGNQTRLSEHQRKAARERDEEVG
jgi:hypothetical protein